MFVRAVVSDSVFARDALLARMNFSDEESRLYAQMQAWLVPQVLQHDPVEWLKASLPALLQRIRRRAIPTKQRISNDHLRVRVRGQGFAHGPAWRGPARGRRGGRYTGDLSTR